MARSLIRVIHPSHSSESSMQSLIRVVHAFTDPGRSTSHSSESLIRVVCSRQPDRGGERRDGSDEGTDSAIIGEGG